MQMQWQELGQLLGVGKAGTSACMRVQGVDPVSAWLLCLPL